MSLRRRIAFLLAASIAPTAWSADLLVDHVNGYTLDASGTLQRFEAMLVDDGKVVATGERATMRARAEGAKVVDGQGRTLLPGLIDAHGHVMGLGTMKRQADLTASTSLDDALAKIKAFASANAGSAWIVGRGWNQVTWKLGRFPTAKELDAAVGDRPVWLERVDGHAAWANSAAIRLAGLARCSPAMSKAVPWSGEVRTKSSPSVTLTPCSKSTVLIGISAWSWYMQTAAS